MYNYLRMRLTVTTTFFIIAFTSTSTLDVIPFNQPSTTHTCPEDQQRCATAGCCHECCGRECCPLQPQEAHFDETATVVFVVIFLGCGGIGAIIGCCMRFKCYKCCFGSGDDTRRSADPVLPTYVYGRTTGSEPSTQVSLLDQSRVVDNLRPSAPVLPPPSYEDAVEDSTLDPNNRIPSYEDVTKGGGGGAGPRN